MCFGGSTSPEMTPAPTIAPAPTPSPSPTMLEPGEQKVTADARRKRLEMLKYGFLSTIKTSPQGVDESGKKKKFGQ